MSKKLTWTIIVLLIITGIALAESTYFSKKWSKEVPVAEVPQQACTKELKICPDGTGVGRTGPNCSFEKCPDVTTSSSTISKQVFTWTFADAGEDAALSAPKTKVTLTAGGKDYDAGTHLGSCTEIDGTSWNLLEGEKLGAICYFAGGGVEFGVFEENGQLVLKQGIVEEGDAETPGSRRDFKLLTIIK